MADDPRRVAKAGLSTAYESYDMAKRLYQAGLMDKQGLDRASTELQLAQDEAGKHATLKEWLEGELKETLRWEDKPKSEELKSLEKHEAELKTEIKREKEQRDRER